MEATEFHLKLVFLVAAFSPFFVAALRNVHIWPVILLVNAGIIVSGHAYLKFLNDSVGQTIGFNLAFDSAVRLAILAVVWCGLLLWAAVAD